MSEREKKPRKPRDLTNPTSYARASKAARERPNKARADMQRRLQEAQAEALEEYYAYQAPLRMRADQAKAEIEQALWEIVNADATELFDEGWRTKNPDNVPKELLRSIQSLTISESKVLGPYVSQITLANRLKAAELLGRLHGLDMGSSATVTVKGRVDVEHSALLEQRKAARELVLSSIEASEAGAGADGSLLPPAFPASDPHIEEESFDVEYIEEEEEGE